MMASPLTARNASMISCHCCHLLCHAPAGPNPADMAACPRCGTALHQRTPDSLARTWALVIAVIVFYIPAMVLPISITTTIGSVITLISAASKAW